MNRARALPILMYHHVSPSPGLVTVSPAVFREHMAGLAGRGWQTVGVDGLESFLRGELDCPKPVMITFDDGYLDNYVHAYPVLKEFGLKAVLFGVTGWIGDGPARPVAGEGAAVGLPNHKQCYELIQAGRADEAIVRWSEVERMAAAGVFELHSHTHSHQRWDRLYPDHGEKRARLEEDLDRSRRTLENRLGRASAHLCWPQGYFDADYQAAAAEAGFTHLYTTRPGTVRPGAAAQTLPRIVTKDRGDDWLGSRLRIYGSPTLARFYSWLKGH